MNQKGNYINRSEVEGYLYAALLSSGLNHNKLTNTHGQARGVV